MLVMQQVHMGIRQRVCRAVNLKKRADKVPMRTRRKIVMGNTEHTAACAKKKEWFQVSDV